VAAEEQEEDEQGRMLDPLVERPLNVEELQHDDAGLSAHPE
jgi:hypothetical protein